MSERIVILGAGIAGVSAAQGLRASGYDGTIDVLEREPFFPYRRPPVSKEVLQGEKSADEVRMRKPEWFDDQRIALHREVVATSIDVAGHSVHVEGREPFAYDRLLVATGGSARNPWDAPGIRTVRGLADVPQLHDEIAAGGPVVIVGAGLIGSEIAATARGFGCAVTLLESASLPLPRMLPPELGRMYLDLHRSQGTDLHTDVMVSTIETDADGSTVVSAVDGRQWRAPVVVVAIGMEPRTELAEQAGIELAAPVDGGGIFVDAFGRTTAPDVFSAGDVANQPNHVLGGRHRVEHWQGAQNHGLAVGKIMAGGSEPYAEVPWAWTDQYGITLQVTGWPQGGHDMVVHGSIAERDFVAYLTDGGVVRGAVSIGRPRDIRTAKVWIDQQARLEDVLPPGEVA